MSKFFDFINETLGSNKIFSREDIGAMKVPEFSGLKNAIAEQVSKIGVPSNKELEASGGAVHVSAYTRGDGTQVREHWRSKASGGLADGNDGGKILRSAQNDEVSALDVLQGNGVSVDTHGEMTGAAANIPFQNWQKTANQHIEDFVVKYLSKGGADLAINAHANLYNMPHASSLYQISSSDNKAYDYINKNGKMLKSISHLNKPHWEESIKKRVKSESPFADSKVMLFNHNSSLASAVLQSREFQQFLRDNVPKLAKYGSIPDTTLDFKQGDLYNSLHGAQIKGVRIDKEGNLELRLEDFYNFNKGRTSVRGRIGEKFQDEGKLKNYYILQPMKIYKKYWEQFK